MKIFITIISIISIIVILVVLNLFFGYIYSYGVKTGSSPVLKGPLNEWHKRGGYEFGSNLLTGKEFPEGLIITLSHPPSGRDSDVGMSRSWITFQVPQHLKHEVIIEDIVLTHKTVDGKIIEPVDERTDGVYLTKKDFPINLGTHKSPPGLTWQQAYHERDFTGQMEGYVYIKLLIDGKPKIIEGTFTLERVKAYWKPALWLSI